MKKIINERPQIDPSPTITTFNSLSFSLVFFFSAPRFSHFSTSFLSLSATPANTQHRHLLTCAGGAMSRARSRSRSPSPSPCCGDSHLVLLLPVMLAVFFNSLLLLPRSSLAIRPTESDRIELANATESSSNVSLSRPREGTFADMIDRALEHEFTENDQNEGDGFLDSVSISTILASFFFCFTYLETQIAVSVCSTCSLVGFWFLICELKPVYKCRIHSNSCHLDCVAAFYDFAFFLFFIFGVSVRD